MWVFGVKCPRFSIVLTKVRLVIGYAGDVARGLRARVRQPESIRRAAPWAATRRHRRLLLVVALRDGVAAPGAAPASRLHTPKTHGAAGAASARARRRHPATVGSQDAPSGQ